jgi:hypothetical protein
MARWKQLIDNLLVDLKPETPGKGFRVNIDHKIWEAETKASNSEPIRLGETPEQRKRDFQAELGEKLAERQKRDLVNQVWGEALALIDNPWLRVTGKKTHRRRPAGDKTG